MVFASGIFLFIFLPITIAGNWFLRNQPTWLKNAFLLIMSAVFYLESGVGQFLMLVMSIIEETEPDLVISMYSAYDLNASGAEALFKFN